MSDQKSETADTSGQTQGGLSLTDRARGCDTWRELIAAAPSHSKQPTEVIWEGDQDASWVPSFGGFLGTSNWQDTQG